jgi:cell division protein FtsA
MLRGHEPPANVIAALDIGSSKVSCLIAAVDPSRGGGGGGPGEPAIQILGFAQSQSRGIKSGVVVDLQAAAQVVRAVVANAEQMARCQIRDVHVAIDCGRPQSKTFTGHVAIADGVVRRGDIEALASGAQAYAGREGRMVLGFNRIGFRLDGIAASSAPVGLAGHRLEADHHVVTFDDGPLSNLALLVESCHLGVASMVPAGYASALAATTADERRLGVTCLDIGAGVTSIATFADGHFLFYDLIPVGGQHLTLDLGRALGIPLAEAERIKALFGTMVLTASDEHELVSYVVAGDCGDGGGRQTGTRQCTTKAEIGRIVRHRMQSLFAMVGERIGASSIGQLPVQRVVLSGGASRLLGLGDFVSGQVFLGPLLQGQGWPAHMARLASPPLVRGLVEEHESPAFACLVGLVIAAETPRQIGLRSPGAARGQGGYFGRMERWLQDSF